MTVKKDDLEFMAEYILYSTYFNQGVTGRWPASVTALARNILFKIHGEMTDGFIELIYDKAMIDKDEIRAD